MLTLPRRQDAIANPPDLHGSSPREKFGKGSTTLREILAFCVDQLLDRLSLAGCAAEEPVAAGDCVIAAPRHDAADLNPPQLNQLRQTDVRHVKGPDVGRDWYYPSSTPPAATPVACLICVSGAPQWRDEVEDSNL